MQVLLTEMTIHKVHVSQEWFIFDPNKSVTIIGVMLSVWLCYEFLDPPYSSPKGSHIILMIHFILF